MAIPERSSFGQSVPFVTFPTDIPKPSDQRQATELAAWWERVRTGLRRIQETTANGGSATGVVAGEYGGANKIPFFSVNQNGVIIAVGEVDLPSISADWTDITGKPSTFPPSAHTHPASQISGLPELNDAGIGASLIVDAETLKIRKVVGLAGVSVVESGNGLELRAADNYSPSRVITFTTVLTATDSVVFAGTGATIFLPSAVGILGRRYNIIRTGTTDVVLSGTGGETISGDPSLTMTIRYASIVVISDGSNWIRCS